MYKRRNKSVSKKEECGDSLKEELEFAVVDWLLICRRGAEALGVAQCGLLW